MRLLLDECVPRRLQRELAGLDVTHVLDAGWSGTSNGELLALMQEPGFTAFVTVDQKLPYQQNIRASGVAVVLIVAKSNRLKDLRPLVPALRSALATANPGDLLRVGE